MFSQEIFLHISPYSVLDWPNNGMCFYWTENLLNMYCEHHVEVRTLGKSSFENLWNFCLHRNRQTWQSYQMCQRRILLLSVKNSLSKPNLNPQFIIRGWSEAGGLYLKITQNCQISTPTSADLSATIFNGIYCTSIRTNLTGFLYKLLLKQNHRAQTCIMGQFSSSKFHLF